MSRFVRASKVRHVFCQAEKPEHHYTDLRLSTATGDHNYVKANSKYFAVGTASGGGGTLTVVPYSNTGKQPALTPGFTGHKGAVLDFEFNPFHDEIIVSGADDGAVRVWQIPDGGLTEHINTPLVEMKKHQRKVTCVRANPNADNIVATSSADLKVLVWDIEKGMDRTSITGAHTQLIQDLIWSYDGTQMVTSSKDKNVRLLDPRSGSVCETVAAHEGSKTSKLVWLGKREKFVSVGFTRQSKRQFKIWDPKNLKAPLCTADVDQAAGVIMPFYDEDTNLLYLAGKGDGNIRYFEVVDADPWQFFIAEYRAGTSQKGIAMLPKRACDVMKCETSRFMKLTSKSVEPLSFIVPRKSDLFQDDIFPDTYAGKPGMTADDFYAGLNKPVPLMSLDPEKRPSDSGSASAFKTSAPKSASALQKELDTANARIKELEAKLKAAGISA